ncbi:hypothetical protein ACDZ29_12270 [Peribacillus sp. RS7]|uniref:hypothetical protein n=1 Tax=Peribacillus sp. RS7 TaxID=3242679 RepID=UPI0035BF4B3A
MDIFLRKIDPVAMKKIDEIAKRKSISRQEFLKSIVEKVAYEPEQNEKEMRLEWIISKNINAMEKMIDKVDQLESLLCDLMEE